MKYCPTCKIEQPDTASFCKFCGELVTSPPEERSTLQCPACGAAVRSDSRFCKQCAAEIQSVAPPIQSAVTPPMLRPAGQPDLPSAVRAAAESTEWRPEARAFTIAPSAAPARRRNLLMAVAVLVVLLVSAGIAYFVLSGSTERKLDEAITKGNLLKPPGESARDYYQQLRREGVSADKLTRFNEKLLPLLTTRPQQMLTELTMTSGKSASAEDWQQARELTAWASEIKPDDSALAARASYCAGRVEYLNNRRDEAAKLWKKASEQDRAWALPLNSLGLVYNERKDYTLARQYLFEAIRRDPKWALPYNNLGTSFFYERDYDQADYYYRQAAERAPQWARPYVWMGDIAMTHQNYQRAVQEYETALKLIDDSSGIEPNKIRQKLDQARQLAGQ